VRRVTVSRAGVKKRLHGAIDGRDRVAKIELIQ
jgi:hypothetical protein